MKNICFLLFCFSSSLAFTQIPNGGFESWTSSFNYEEPEFWETNNDTTHIRVARDPLSIEGEYSMKLSSNVTTAFLDCTSKATLNYKLTQPVGVDNSFSFNLRLLPDSSTNSTSTFFSFFCLPFVNGMSQPAIIWQSDETYEDFTKIEIPILNPEIDSIFVEIASGAIGTVNDGCAINTEAWVDGFSIDVSSTSTDDLTKSKVSIYPNPTDQIVFIEQENNEYHEYFLFNSCGQKIQHGDLSRSEISIDGPGIYFLQLIGDFAKNQNIVQKIVVSK